MQNVTRSEGGCKNFRGNRKQNLKQESRNKPVQKTRKTGKPAISIIKNTYDYILIFFFVYFFHMITILSHSDC